MPSAAAIRYRELASRADVILKANRRMLGHEEVQAIYGAVLLAQVAAWNAYVVRLIDCFFQEVADPSVANFHAIHTLANAAAKSQIERFNTPNAENTRSLILRCTGYDPWTDWQWPARKMSALAVQQRLNEILKVRHSLAHGSAMPGYAWTQTPSGATRVTLRTLAWTRAFFNRIVTTTDIGLRSHLHTVYGVVPVW